MFAFIEITAGRGIVPRFMLEVFRFGDSPDAIPRVCGISLRSTQKTGDSVIGHSPQSLLFGKMCTRETVSQSRFYGASCP